MRKVKKICLGPLLMAAVCAVLAGCGGKEIEYNTDNDKAHGGNSLKEQLGVPDSYSAVLDGISSSTNLREVVVDADSISVPDTDSMSIVSCEQNEYSGEYAKQVCEAVFDTDAGVYVYDGEHWYTKDVETLITEYEKLVAKALDDETVTQLESIISDLQEIKRNSTTERTPAGDYDDEGLPGGEHSYIGYIDGRPYRADFWDNGGFDINILYVGSLITYRPTENAISAYTSDGYDIGDEANLAEMTEDEAKERALDVFRSCGISEIACRYKSNLAWVYSFSDGLSDKIEFDGYFVNFARAIDDVSVFCDYIDSDIIGKTDRSDDFHYSVNVSEDFGIELDDDTIIRIYGSDFYKVTEEREKNVELISWDKVLEILPAAINEWFGDTGSKYSKIVFDDVRLTYYMVNNEGTYAYTPVWVFAEHDDETEEYTDDIAVGKITNIIMIDATNGDLIDRQQIKWTAAVE